MSLGSHIQLHLEITECANHTICAVALPAQLAVLLSVWCQRLL